MCVRIRFVSCFAAVTFAGVLLAGCSEAPTPVSTSLGTATISDHATPFGTLTRRECQFRVTIRDLTLTFTGSLTDAVTLNKCKALKNGDKIDVVKKSMRFKDGHEDQIQYAGKINEVTFTLR